MLTIELWHSNAKPLAGKVRFDEYFDDEMRQKNASSVATSEC